MSFSSSPSAKIEVLPDSAPAHGNKQPAQDARTIGTLVVAYEALATIASEKFTPRASARILKLANWSEPLYKDAIALRNREATRLGDPIDGGKFKIRPENLEEFRRIVSGEFDKPVAIPSSLLLTIDDLQGAQISPITLTQIGAFLRDLE